MSSIADDGRRTPDCTIRFEGEDIPAVRGEPVAVALFAAGTHVLSRSIKYHRPRSFFCLAGHCGSCLMRVGGVPNVKSCRAPVEPGLEVERQNAFPSGSFDVLGAADWFFPKGMDHHTLMTSSRALNALMRRVVREIGGLGKLPDESTVPSELPASTRRHVDVAIVGGGPAGLSAALAIAKATGGRERVVLLDEGDRPGGSLLTDPMTGAGRGPAAAEALARAAEAAGVEIRSNAVAVGFYPEDEGGVLAVDDAGALLRLSAERLVYATGGYDTNALFGDNDRPGICAARAVGALLVRHGVVPGKRPIVLGRGEYPQALAAALDRAGCAVTRVGDDGEEAVRSLGQAWVTGLEVQAKAGGKARKVACDLVAVWAPPAPASELPRMHGAAVEFRAEGGGFAVVTDEQGRSSAPNVFACGDVCGYGGVARAMERGEAVGRAVAETL